MTQGSYKQFCPVAMASEIICTRWTMVLLRELIAGSTRFNNLRRGVPRMSPALLSKRLKDLEDAGVLVRPPVENEPGFYEYKLTPAGLELETVVISVGNWGQRWVETKPSMANVDPELLMWDMRRNLNVNPLPKQRCVIQFIYNDLPKNQKNWWLIVAPEDKVDLCSIEPGFDVDLYVSVDLKTMTEIWMGLNTVSRAIEQEKMYLTGNKEIEKSIQTWLGLSPFSAETKQVA